MKIFIIISVFLFISCTGSENENYPNYPNPTYPEFYPEKVEVYAIDSTTTLSALIKLCYIQGKTPILYFHADWCQPCTAFKKTLNDKQMVKEFKNALLLGVNIDLDPYNLTALYSVHVVPTFIKLDRDSNEVSRITSAEWDEDTPASIAPVMNKLINQTVYNKK